MLRAGMGEAAVQRGTSPAFHPDPALPGPRRREPRGRLVELQDDRSFMDLSTHSPVFRARTRTNAARSDGSNATLTAAAVRSQRQQAGGSAGALLG